MDKTSPMIGEVSNIYKRLEIAVESYMNESIDEKKFKEIINELNKNTFGIHIDENLVPNNRVSFNEHGFVSYDDIDYIEDSYSDDN